MNRHNTGPVSVLRWIAFIGILCLGAYWFFLGGMVSANEKNEPVEVIFAGTQNDADCIIFIQGDACAMIDTGEAGDAGTIQALLEGYGIQTIELLILTHPDQDHIGGAASILEHFTVGTVVQPQYSKPSALLDALNETIAASGARLVYPTHTRKFTVGGMVFAVYNPLERHYGKDNNYSLATLVTHGKVNMLFAGDAQEKRLNELIQYRWPDVTLCNAPHHGRADQSTAAFLMRLSPQYIICTSTGSDEAIRWASAGADAQLFYTRGNTQYFRSDGRKIQFQQTVPL